MARRIDSRLKITGKLIACGPLHVGGMGGNADVDLPLAINGNGELYVPGTSLAGPIRSWLLRQVDEARIREAWGYQEQGSIDQQAEGHASFVTVDDGLVTLPAGATVETRDGVGIDRVTGAAAEHIKYNRAVLPSGSEITFEMTLELVEQNAGSRSLIVSALQALERGEIRLGASKTRGLGKVVLDDLSVCEQELLTFRGMLDALRGRHRTLDIKSLTAESLSGIPTLLFKIDWAPSSPLMVKAERDGVAIDMLPLVSADGSDLTFVLPGSSIKGSLRSQAERIVRTVGRVPTRRKADSRTAFLRNIEILDREGDENNEESLIGALFGVAGKSKKKEIEDDGPPLLGLSALGVEDCYARPRFSPSQWEAIETAPEAIGSQIIDQLQSPLQQAIQRAGLASHLQQAYHVAIDRWTGGAADGFLYTALEPHGVEWAPLQLTLDLARLREEDHRAAVMCLLLTLRDLVKGRIPLGFAANRGMGAINIKSIEITPSNLAANDDLNGLRDVKIVDGKLGGWSETLKTSLEGEWLGWRAKNTGEVTDDEAVQPRG
jgi:CRISPR/Cas system CSM-associated protein Csm3 (group 7 of RAMP superfamily)